MQELVDFFGWPAKHITDLGKGELRAWKKHFIALRKADFFYIKEQPDVIE